MNYNQNLKDLRNNLTELKADAVLIAMNNSFGNFEDSISGIQYISGFSGSNGRALVSQNEALLSVDGRYTKQATDQTDSSLWEIGMYPQLDLLKMISKIMKKGQTLAIGPFSSTYKSYQIILKASSEIGFKIKILDESPIPQEKISETELFLVDENDKGETTLSRVKKIQDTLKDGESILISDKALIGWIFGIRLKKATSEKSVLPNAIAFIQKSEKPMIFCDLKLNCKKNDFSLLTFEEFNASLKLCDKSVVNLDFSNIPIFFAKSLQDNGFSIKSTERNYGHFEAIKNETEIKNQKIAAELTSIAFIKTLSYVENSEKTSEIEVADYFESALKENSDFIDLSFNQISAFQKNTAIVHYNAKVFGNTPISGDGLFLFDAGAHFKKSTTDMTRTIYLGSNPNDKIKKLYSIVLKSIIAFSMAKFPDNTKSYQLDSIARSKVWMEGFDYNFGTGHGVGSFGNVHEHPRLSPNSSENITSDMVVTVEPGIYKNDFGIRMENMLLTKKSEFQNFVEFETMTFVPFCKKLIIPEIFDAFEKNWINNYNEQIKIKFAKLFENDIKISNWLFENTQKIL